MTRYNMKQRLNCFCQSGVSAIKKEVRQLVIMDALDPDEPKELRREYCRAKMAYLMFLKEKQGGTIKAQSCCDGIVQRNYMKKDETSSPTAMQKILMVNCIINAMEGCNVAVANIPGAFLQMDMVHVNRIVRIRLCGVLLDILVNIEPEKFADKVILEGGQKVIYASLEKDLYGALISNLIFWRDLSSALESWGFNPDLYDSCRGKCLILWHVDDLNILHVIPKVVYEVLSQLTTKYGKVSALSS